MLVLLFLEPSAFSTEIIGSLIGVIGTFIALGLTYYFLILQSQQSLQQKQKYKYFLPFKYQAEEFWRRLWHINDRLSFYEKIKEIKLDDNDEELNSIDKKMRINYDSDQTMTVTLENKKNTISFVLDTGEEFQISFDLAKIKNIQRMLSILEALRQTEIK